MRTREAISGIEEPQKSETAGRSFEFLDVIEGIKSGSKKHAGIELFADTIKHLKPEQRQPLIEHLVRDERLSGEAAERFLTDAKFQRRVIELCRNFSEHDEKMLRLEEAEIWTEIMEPGCDQIDALLQSTNPQERFNQLEPLDADKRMRKRLMDLRKELPSLLKTDGLRIAREVFKDAFEQVGIPYTGTDQDWADLFSKTEAMDKFLALESVQDLYNQCTFGKNIDALSRRIQLYWTTTEEGERRPTVNVQQMAENPKTKYVSELGFSIEKEPPQNGVEGEGKRVLKDVLVIIDAESRNRNEGAEFLLGNMRLIKEYKLDEAEFVANINVGSYVWARISDVDVRSMADKLPPPSKKELGPKPWDEKKAKGLVFRDEILPLFERHLATAIWSVVGSIKDPKEKKEMQKVLVDDLLNVQYEKLKKRALAGDLTMEDLVALGKGIEVFRFNNNGNIVPPNSPEATHAGHLGKAAIMGVPWKARIGLDRQSLNNVIDRLSKGRGLVPFLKKSSKKLGLALSL
ncbi:hypothetical protein KKF59_01990 [Patescibacteria group bacterium]|nr:hypothetical protein [Patescibacteria group bacterium]